MIKWYIIITKKLCTFIINDFVIVDAWTLTDCARDLGFSKLKDVFSYYGGPFWWFLGKIADFGSSFLIKFFNFFQFLFLLTKFLYFYIFMIMYLGPPTGMWLKIAIFCREKGSPSEDVRSNAVYLTTYLQRVCFITWGGR